MNKQAPKKLHTEDLDPQILDMAFWYMKTDRRYYNMEQESMSHFHQLFQQSSTQLAELQANRIHNFASVHTVLQLRGMTIGDFERHLLAVPGFGNDDRARFWETVALVQNRDKERTVEEQNLLKAVHASLTEEWSKSDPRPAPLPKQKVSNVTSPETFAAVQLEKAATVRGEKKSASVSLEVKTAA